MRKKIFKFIYPLILMIVCFVTTFNVYAASETTLEYNFKEINTLEDFQAIHTTSAHGGVSTLVEFDDYWKLDENGLSSTNKKISIGSTDNISYLSLSKYVFSNFSAEITGKFTIENFWGWFGITCRQDMIGNGFFDDGVFCGVQMEGIPLIWGGVEQGGGPFEGQNPSHNKLSEKTLKIRVVNKQITVIVFNQNNKEISRVTNKFDERVIEDGFVSIASIDNNHTITNFKITNLDENGSPKKLVDAPIIDNIEVTNKVENLSLNQNYKLEYNVNSTNANLSQIRVVSDNPDVILTSGNSLTALSEGAATIKVFSILNPNVFDTFTVNVSRNNVVDGRIVINMNSIENIDKLDHNYVLDVTGKDSGDYDDYTKYWRYNEQYNGIERINDNSNDPANDIASILIPKQLFTNFEITLVYQNTNKNKGWIGVIGGHTKENKRFMDSGFGAFVQTEGYATIWGEKTNGVHEEKGLAYDIDALHVMRVKVYNGLIELYIDNLNTPAITCEVGTTVTNTPGQIGVFSSGEGYVIKSISYGYLNDDGTLREYLGVKDFDIQNMVDSAKVGDVITPEIIVNEDATNKNIVIESSNSNVCIAKNGKLIFIGEGEVTLTFYPEDAPFLSKEYKINVSNTSSNDGNIAKPPFNYNPNKGLNNINPLLIVNISLGCISIAGLVLILISKKRGDKE